MVVVPHPRKRRKRKLQRRMKLLPNLRRRKLSAVYLLCVR
jgi:hypothetical protein